MASIGIIERIIDSQLLCAVVSSLFTIFLKDRYDRRFRPFFSHSYSKQLEGINLLKSPPEQSKDPLHLAVQQAKLKSFGLHPNWFLSRRLISFSTCENGFKSHTINTVIRYSGAYSTQDGKIYIHKGSFLTLFGLLIAVMVIWISPIFSRINIHSHRDYFWGYFFCLNFALMVWFWMLKIILDIKIFSREFNKYECEIIIDGVNYSYPICGEGIALIEEENTN
ncbi:hypothetical protein HGT71_05855 [Rosenbergiella epipactidis]|uniref:hypothetical protein n=1 Tax=Rosenbergiella epipactidis TaxID=1544694 RepID=UPI001BDA86D7|nr:hypothetical protein [Rosenbergiella epipactidis]MBT0717796.1 hypothetical protein [Rosenbergiella epipactidis]